MRFSIILSSAVALLSAGAFASPSAEATPFGIEELTAALTPDLESRAISPANKKCLTCIAEHKGRYKSCEQKAMCTADVMCAAQKSKTGPCKTACPQKLFKKALKKCKT